MIIEGRVGGASHEDDNKTPRYLEQTAGGSRAATGSRLSCAGRVTYGLEAGDVRRAFAARWAKNRERAARPRPRLGQGRAETRSRRLNAYADLCSLAERRCVHVRPSSLIFSQPTLPPFLHPFYPLPAGLSPTTHPPVRLATDPHIQPDPLQPQQRAAQRSPPVCPALLIILSLAAPRRSSPRRQPVPAGNQLHLPCGCRQVHTHQRHAHKPHAWVHRYTAE